jgi:hypothetical protein
MPETYLFLADALLVLHFLFVLFVIIGLGLIVLGGWRGWPWVHNRWVRWLHLAAIAVVVAQAWLGQACPLTTLEMWLRSEAGEVAYQGSFIQYWVSRLLYYRAPAWVFTLAYTAFGALVALAWIKVPPGERRDTD